MASLTIAGTNYTVAEDWSILEPVQAGTRTRTFNNGLRSSVRSEKRGWRLPLGFLNQSAYLALKSAVALGAFVTCAGDVLDGDTITASVTITDVASVPVQDPGGDGLGFMYAVTLTVLEV